MSTNKYKTNTKISTKSFEVLDNNTLWCTESSDSHEKWITNLVSKLLQTFADKIYLKHLEPLCKLKVEFAEHLLPLIIYMILCENNEVFIAIISKQLRNFFNAHWNILLVNNEIVCNKMSVKCILNVVHYIRLQQNLQTYRKISDLDLDYLKVAKAAIFCEAYFTAIMYVELWCRKKIASIEINVKDSIRSVLDYVCCNENSEIFNMVRNILRKSYMEVGDIDALEGWGISNYLETTNICKEIGRWDLVALNYDIQISQGDKNAIPSYQEALLNWGILNLPFDIGNVSTKCFYKCATRLSNWELKEYMEISKEDNFEMYNYYTLKNLLDWDSSSFKNAIDGGRKSIADSLRHVSLESCKNLYPALTCLQELKEIEEFAEAKKNRSFDNLIVKWKMQDDMNKNKFEYIEPVKDQRITMFRDFVSKEDSVAKKNLIDLYLDLAGRVKYLDFEVTLIFFFFNFSHS